MMSCQQATRLMSARLDRRLSFRERVALAFHLGMCRLCRGFSSELERLRDFARRYGSDDQDNGSRLSDEARQRIEQRLREESH